MDIFVSQPDSLLRRIHPSLRAVAAIGFALCASFLRAAPALVLALGMGMAVMLFARRSLLRMLRRTLFLNFALIGLGLTVALGQDGEPWIGWGALSFSREGIGLALTILARANAILWVAGGLLGSLEPTEIGYALDRLHMPARLTHLLLFMVRYIETIHREYHRVRDAMDARGFRARSNLHTLRNFGNLLGVLLLRSLDRSERILAAMRCRGFHGRFYVLFEHQWRRPDLVFGGCAAFAVFGMLLLEAWR